jgi:hypothetical protein
VSSVPDNIRTIYIVGGQKGGVGKTAICQALCQYLIDAENRGKQSFTLIEADAQIDDVGRMYRDQVETQTITVSDDPAKRSNPDVIYETAAVSHKDVVVNLPSNILDVFQVWLEDLGVIDSLKQRFDGRVRLLKIFVSDGCWESIRQLQKSVEMLDHAIPHLLVLNEGRVSAADFSYLEAEALYQDIKTSPNLIDVFTFPAMEPRTRYYIDKSGLGLRGALQRSEQDSQFLVAQRIQNFIRDVSATFTAMDAAAEDWFNQDKSWRLSAASSQSSSGGAQDQGKRSGDSSKQRTEAAQAGAGHGGG